MPHNSANSPSAAPRSRNLVESLINTRRIQRVLHLLRQKLEGDYQELGDLPLSNTNCHKFDAMGVGLLVDYLNLEQAKSSKSRAIFHSSMPLVFENGAWLPSGISATCTSCSNPSSFAFHIV